MQSTPAKLGIRTEQAVQQLEQPKAEMSIQQQPAELHIDTSPGRLSIDQTQAWADMDLKSVFRRTEDFARQGYEDWLAGLARMARQGDELMKIENGGNPIVSQAKENSEDPMYDFNIGWIPSAGSVKINYEPGDVEIDWTPNRPEIDVKINKPVHRYSPGSVNFHMEQWNSLKIDFEKL
ncbi:DUF6470 family protein [Bacillus marinisedimentorum]|uniref:DUF6470 family protein n=1 Tax=Bacillus marinisedimentorum TaxID=1821260 RepID=UPI00316AC095